MDVVEESREWMRTLPGGQFRHLFDHLAGTLMFVKDRDGRIRAGNPAFVRRCGFEDEPHLLGLTDDAIFPPKMARKFRGDDLQVMETGRPLRGIIELFPNADGRPEWFVTDKQPLFGMDGGICGVCGTVRSFEQQRAAIQPYLELAPVAEHLKAKFREPLDVASLAEMAGLSVRQFERKFRNTFQTTPRAYLMRMRVIHACEMLAQSRAPITEIALESGFYDHSDFSRQFRRLMGQSPSEYREGKRSRR